MTEAEFDAEARRRLAAAGATDIDIHPGTDALILRCKLGTRDFSCRLAHGCGRSHEDMFRDALNAIDYLRGEL